MHVQRSGLAPIVKRRFKREYFAIDGDLQPGPPRFYGCIRYRNQIHLFHIFRAFQENFPGEPQKPRPPLRVQHVQGEALPSQRFTRPRVKAGHAVAAFDLSADALARAVEHGAVATASAAEAVKEADIVITMLPAGQHVRQVYAEQVAPNAKAGAETICILS